MLFGACFLIPVHYCRLQKRETSGDNRGFQSDFETVLMLLMLDDREDYLANEIAQRICPKEKDDKRYKTLNRRIYQRGFRRGLTDHLDLEPNKPGEKSTWTGKQWKASINDREWHISIEFFQHLKARKKQHEAVGNGHITFYFDHQFGLIESDIPHLPLIEVFAPQSSWPKQGFYRNWSITSILRQDLNDDQQAVLAKYEQPVTAFFQQRQNERTQETQNTSSIAKQFFGWLANHRRRQIFGLLSANIAMLAAIFLLAHQPKSTTATEFERFKQFQGMNGSAAIQGLEQILADEASELEKAWVIQALAEKLMDEPSEDHLERLRELYRSEAADRDQLTDLIASIQEKLYLNPLFLDNPKQPRMIGAIEKNPIVVFDEGMLRPGDWLNIDHVTGYVKEIHPNHMIVISDGVREEISFDPPEIFNMEFRENKRLIIYPSPLNLRLVLKAVCELESIEAYLGEIDGFITGSFDIEEYQTFLEIVLRYVEGDFDGEAFVLFPSNQPTIIFQTPSLYRDNESLKTFFEELSHLTGFRFQLPSKSTSNFTFYFIDFDWQSLFESLNWSYTYDYQSKTVRAKERER